MKQAFKLALLALPLLLQSESKIVLLQDYPPVTATKTVFMYIVKADGSDGHCIEVSIPVTP